MALEEIEGFDFEYSKRFYPKEEVILETLKMMKKVLPNHIAEIVSLYENLDQGDNKELCRIKVHGMKGLCNGMGQLTIFQLAKLTEMALREDNMKRVDALMPILIEECQKCHQILMEAKSLEEPKAKALFDVNNLKIQLETLKSSMVSLDYALADKTMEEINQYAYDESLASDIEDLHKAELEFDIDTVSKLCDRLLSMTNL